MKEQAPRLVSTWWVDVRTPVLLEPQLSESDRRRLVKLHRSVDRLRGALGTALLRLAAAHTMQIEPMELTVTRVCPSCDSDEHGRPVVKHVSRLSPHVSLTHAGDLVGVASCWSSQVGIDVEPVPSDAVGAEVAETALSPREYAVFQDLPVAERADWIAASWTRKEAVGKAMGVGMMIDPVLIDTHSGCVWRYPGPGRSHGQTRFGVTNISVRVGYAAAVSAGGGLPSIAKHDGKSLFGTAIVAQ